MRRAQVHQVLPGGAEAFVYRRPSGTLGSGFRRCRPHPALLHELRRNLPLLLPAALLILAVRLLWVLL